MNGILLLTGVVILACILAHRFTEKLPIPTLLVFIGLGMLFGENGLFRIRFNNYSLAETVCSVCLIFIMYYGGFGTNWRAARPVAVQSVLLSTLGVLLTAGLTGSFIHLVLQLSWLESLLIGSVIASTDAASVFNILRSRSLNLKFNTASLLELESGSNDPMSYMLTVVLVTLMTGGDISVPLVLAKQLVRRVHRVCGRFSSAAYPCHHGPGRHHLRVCRCPHRLCTALHAGRQRLPERVSVRHSDGQRAHCPEAGSGALF